VGDDTFTCWWGWDEANEVNFELQRAFGFGHLVAPHKRKRPWTPGVDITTLNLSSTVLLFHQK